MRLLNALGLVYLVQSGGAGLLLVLGALLFSFKDSNVSGLFLLLALMAIPCICIYFYAKSISDKKKNDERFITFLFGWILFVIAYIYVVLFLSGAYCASWIYVLLVYTFTHLIIKDAFKEVNEEPEYGICIWAMLMSITWHAVFFMVASGLFSKQSYILENFGDANLAIMTVLIIGGDSLLLADLIYKPKIALCYILAICSSIFVGSQCSKSLSLVSYINNFPLYGINGGSSLSRDSDPIPCLYNRMVEDLKKDYSIAIDENIKCPECHNEVVWQGETNLFLFYDGLLGCTKCERKWYIEGVDPHKYENCEYARIEKAKDEAERRICHRLDAFKRYPNWSSYKGNWKKCRKQFMKPYLNNSMYSKKYRKDKVLMPKIEGDTLWVYSCNYDWPEPTQQLADSISYIIHDCHFSKVIMADTDGLGSYVVIYEKED